ncbi:MAG: hypothetical protein GDA54_07095, partial [Alphaproteobacteria bacterium GM7ARS4]|nr:hypothetical protein [Alphaproteobacteria bacterium GM7ARS4]
MAACLSCRGRSVLAGWVCLALVVSACGRGGVDFSSANILHFSGDHVLAQSELQQEGALTVEQRAVEQYGNEMDTNTSIIVSDVTQGVTTQGDYTGDASLLALPSTGCTLVAHGHYVNYLGSYRHETPGEFDCLSSCPKSRRASMLLDGMRVLLCVGTDEIAAGRFLFLESDCAHRQGFHGGQCITPTEARHCQVRQRVLNRFGNACQFHSACEDEGHRVVSHTCQARTADACMGNEGFESGVCVDSANAQQCANRGAFVLAFDGSKGCVASSACADEGYRIVAHACVANLATNCTGSQGFTMGRCIAPTSASHCASRGGDTYVYTIGEDGCERQSACEGLGYRIVESACVANLATNCTGSQGFTMGRCVAPTSASHCANRGGDTYVYNIGEDGCERQSACEGLGYRIVAHACVANLATNCTGSQGFTMGRCITPTSASHCANRGGDTYVYSIGEDGCERQSACEGLGYRIVESACVANLATNCTGSQGFTMGRCVAPT